MESKVPITESSIIWSFSEDRDAWNKLLKGINSAIHDVNNMRGHPDPDLTHIFKSLNSIISIYDAITAELPAISSKHHRPALIDYGRNGMRKTRWEGWNPSRSGIFTRPEAGDPSYGCNSHSSDDYDIENNVPNETSYDG